MTTKDHITKEMTIEEIFSSFPHKAQKLAQEITNVGLHCVGCQAATWETLEAGMLGHGYSEQQIHRLVEDLNEILTQKSDPNSIQFTKRAAEKFREFLIEEGKVGWHLRLADQAAGCSGFEYSLDYSQAAKEDDAVFQSHGIEIHVNQKMLSRLIGSEIDYVEGLNQSSFKISNPNVRGSCGCGKSQSY